MAREAGWKDLRDYDSEMRHDFFMGNTDSLKALVALVRADERNKQGEAFQQILSSVKASAIADEREACAVIAETPISGEQDDITMQAKDRVAAAIRARGNT
jgi:hypothetical protein